mgnify:FL=1
MPVPSVAVDGYAGQPLQPVTALVDPALTGR